MREYKKWKTQMGLLAVAVAVICVAAAGSTRRKEKQRAAVESMREAAGDQDSL